MTIYCSRCEEPPLNYVEVYGQIFCRACAKKEYEKEVKRLKQMFLVYP